MEWLDFFFDESKRLQHFCELQKFNLRYLVKVVENQYIVLYNNKKGYIYVICRYMWFRDKTLYEAFLR